jgi:hypothetical protein
MIRLGGRPGGPGGPLRRGLHRPGRSAQVLSSPGGEWGDLSLPLRRLTLVRGLVKPEAPVGKAVALV